LREITPPSNTWKSPSKAGEIGNPGNYVILLRLKFVDNPVIRSGVIHVALVCFPR
jgi:hypothetical protein